MPLAPTVYYSLVEGSRVVNSVNGQLVIVPCVVKGVSIEPPASGQFGGDSTVLTRVSPFLPSLYTPHPDTVNYPYLTLREYEIRSYRASFSEVHVDLIYRAPGPSDWVLEEISQSEYLRTFTTANSQKQITCWYKQGASNTVTSPPAGAKLEVPADGVQKYVGKRILKAKGWMKYAAWTPIRANVRTALWTLNHSQWGDDPVADATGCWLFANMITSTHDLNRTKNIELFFINDPGGWYPITQYLDINNRHPGDGTTEAQLRAVGLPVIGGQITMNGITRSSIYNETEFNAIFNFDPSQA